MRTPLDDARTWFLQGIECQEELQIFLVEGKHGAARDRIIRGKNFGPAHRIEIAEDSRKLMIHFPGYVAFQVIDERLTAQDEYEQDDGTGFLRLCERSRYLDHVTRHHGWFRELVGPARHYRLLTATARVDVIAPDEPAIEDWQA